METAQELSQVNLFRDVPRTVYSRKSFDAEEFIEALKRDKPRELFVTLYSQVVPLYVVEHYYPLGLSFRCTAWANKAERNFTYEEFYDFTANERSQMFYQKQSQ